MTLLMLDNSGSMSGVKYDSALSGVIKLIKDQKENEEIRLVQFSSKIQFDEKVSKDKDLVYLEEKLKKQPKETTSIFNSFVEIVTKYYSNLDSDTNLLVNIFTDGQDNEATKKEAEQCFRLFKTLQNQGHTISFMCTLEDKDYIINKCGVDASNVFAYENNSKGIDLAFNATLTARFAYHKNLSEGKDVSLGFYKNL